MILIDSNIPMYLIGKEHPLKHRALVICQELATSGKKILSDAEVIQEILHRYVAIGRRDAIQPCLDALYGLIDEMLPVRERDALDAKDLILGYPELSARDALHASILQNHGIEEICTFDSGFDILPFVRRIC